MIYNPEMPGSGMGKRLCTYSEPVKPYSAILAAAGYDLHHVGKWHIGSWFGVKPSDYGFRGQFYPGYGYPFDHPHYNRYLAKYGADGFEVHRSREGKATERYFSEHRVPAEASIPGYLCSQAATVLKKTAKSDDPFFLAVNFWGPHIPVRIPPEYLYMYNPDDMPLPPNFYNVSDNRPEIVDMAHRSWGGAVLDEKMVRSIIAKYYGYVTLIDHQVGRVLDTLEKTGQADNTTIIFTSDHGSTLGAHGLQDKGLNMYDEVYRIPLIISGAGVAKPGSTTDRFVITMDTTATFVDLAGRKKPAQYDGSSLTPYMKGDLKHKIRTEVVTEGFGHQVPFVQRAVRDNRYKYIFNTTAVDEFYDIANDPYETLNLIDTVDDRLLRRYRKKLLDWGTEHQDHPVITFGEKSWGPRHRLGS